jgi:cytochrome b561
MTKIPPATHHRHHHRVGFRLERWHRRAIYSTGAVLLLSGVAWLVLRYFLRPASEFGETINPFEPWAMKLHGAAAMVTLFFVGSLVHVHVRRALKHGRNLATGWSMIGSLLFLVLTGYGLYYVAGESDRPVWSALHWVVGIAVAVLFVLHIVIGRRSVAES